MIREQDLPVYTKSNLCQLDDLKLSCIGCCGSIRHPKADVERHITQNTREHKNHIQQQKEIKSFIWRFPPNKLRSCGICPNLIKDDVRKNKILCPGHPEKNNNKDHRQDYCDMLHLCKTAFLYDLWQPELKQRFMAFIKNKQRKGLDWYDYSLGMDSDSLLIEFEESKFWNR